MYFEEFRQGDRFETRSRVVTPTDIDNFAITTGAVNPLFLDDKHAQAMGMESRIAPGLLTLSLAVGLVYARGLFDHVLAMMEVEVNFLASVHAGDKIKVTAAVVETRETSRDDRGIVVLKLDGQNQEAKPVIAVSRFTALVQRK